MKTRNQIELDAVESEMGRKADEIREIWARADKEERGSTPEETAEVERLYKHIESVLKPRKSELEDAIQVEDNVRKVSKDLGRGQREESGVELGPDGFKGVRAGDTPYDKLAAGIQKSLGRQFVESEGFKSVHDRWTQGGGRHTFSIAVETKAGTLTEAATLGAGLIPVPQVVPGVVQTLFQRLTVRDLLLQGQATTNSLRYIVEGTATSGAVGVAEAAAKPASAVGLSTVDEPVKKIATSLVISDEMMEDVPQVESYVNGRLSLFIQNRVEASIINGAGTNDLVGLLQGARGINSMAKGGGIGGTSVDNSGDALFRAMNGIRGSAFLEPDWIVISPAAWQNIRLLRDAAGGTAGQYMGGGPFTGPYGVGGAAGIGDLSNQASGANDYIWGKPTYVSSALSAGSALVGTRSAAQVWSRSGISVEATNSGYLSGVDLFTSNLVALRAEERLALALYRPAAFCLVTGL